MLKLTGILPETWSTRNHFQLQQFQGMVVLTALYGTAHLAAWDYSFPGEAEMWLWRVSALSLVGLPALISVGTPVVLVYRYLRTKGDKRKEAGRRFVWLRCLAFVWWWTNAIVFLTPLGCLFAAMWFGRVFILVESFISLRAPPNGTYVAVGWTRNLPHLG